MRIVTSPPATVCAAAAIWLALCLGGCAETKYYEITDKRTGDVSYSTALPESETAAGPDVPGSQSLVGRRRGVSEQYIVREISRSEYQQRRTESTGGAAAPE